MTDDRVERVEECAVCGEEVEIGGFPPEYYYPLDQSDAPDHKVRLAPNPSGPLACDYECLVEFEGEVREWTQHYARTAPLIAGTARRAAESLAEGIDTESTGVQQDGGPDA